MQTDKDSDPEQAASMVTLMSGLGSEDEDGCVSSPGSAQFDDGGDLMAAAMGDEVTAQLAAAGPVGVAAAAAIVSAKKRKRPHSFETNPSIRKRQQNRLLRKLKQTIDEFATRVGQQAVVVVATPGKPTNSFKVFGAKPLEDVMKNIRCVIMEELESALAQQAPPPVQDDPSLYELPPLVIDGIPTPVEKMTQAQLRAFIPLMLKYSTGRGKPGWGRDSTRPAWWPKDLPWANVRMDARSEEEKHKQISWTHALRQIVINCYKYHGREDLLPAFSEEDEKQMSTTTTTNSSVGKLHTKATIEVVDGSDSPTSTLHATQVTAAPTYAQTILQTISNPDGTVSIIQVDPSNPIITLPDGTTAQVQGVATLTQGDGIGSLGESVELNGVSTEGGQIILTGEDGHGFPVSVSGMITVPVGAGMYQTVVQQIPSSEAGSAGEDRLFQVVAPMQVQVPKVEPQNEDGTVATSGAGSDNGSESVNSSTNNVEAILGATHQVVTIGGDTQVLQVLSLKEATQVLKASSEIKEESNGQSIDQ